MNIKFQKALFMLDKGQFEKAEILLQESFEESKSDYEKIQITACYAEFVAPYAKAVVDAARERNIPCFMHVCGNIVIRQKQTAFE